MCRTLQYIELRLNTYFKKVGAFQFVFCLQIHTRAGDTMNKNFQ